MNEQNNTATDIINTLTETPTKVLTIATDTHTFTVNPDGTFTQKNSR